MRQFAALFAVLLIAGCTSPHKTFKPPSSAKVDASTEKVKATARAAKKHVEDAQKSADKIAILSLTVQQKLDQIARNAPAELQPYISAVKGDVAEMQKEEIALTGFLDSAHKRQDELEGKITTLESDQRDYYTEAKGLADAATNERENLIKTQKALIASRFGGLMMKLGAILSVVIVIALIILKIAGRLAFK